jgi:HSP20 family protein
MADIVRRDPFGDLGSTMDRLFEEGFSRPWRLLRGGVDETRSFPVEVSETEHEIEVSASLPGVSPDDIDVTVHDDVLMIKAEHRREAEDKQKNYYRRELEYGMMQRAISLPARIEAERAEATYENGMLKLRLPKAESERRKQIKVTGGNQQGAAELRGAMPQQPLGMQADNNLQEGIKEANQPS